MSGRSGWNLGESPMTCLNPFSEWMSPSTRLNLVDSLEAGTADVVKTGVCFVQRMAFCNKETTFVEALVFSWLLFIFIDYLRLVELFNGAWVTSLSGTANLRKTLFQQPSIDSSSGKKSGTLFLNPCSCWNFCWLDLVQDLFMQSWWPLIHVWKALSHPENSALVPLSTTLSLRIFLPLFLDDFWALGGGYVL